MAAPPLDVDWQAVQMLSREVGVREAARRFELNEDTVCARSAREGWFKDLNAIAADPHAAAIAVLPTSMRPKSVASIASSPALIQRKALEELGENSRFNLAKAIKKASVAASELSEDEALSRSSEVLTTAKAAQVVHGWKGAESTQTLRLEVLAQMSQSRESSDKVVECEMTVERETGAETGQESDEL